MNLNESFRDAFSIVGEYTQKSLHMADQQVMFSGLFLSAREFPLSSPAKGIIHDADGVDWAIGGSFDFKRGSFAFRKFPLNEYNPDVVAWEYELQREYDPERESEDLLWLGEYQGLKSSEGGVADCRIRLYKADAAALGYKVVPNFPESMVYRVHMVAEDLILAGSQS